MEKFDLTGLPGLKRHPELKEHLESARRLIQAEEYRAAAGELRQALEYVVDCYGEAARAEGGEVTGGQSLHDRIEALKNGDWITLRQAGDFHEIRMRCNAGVHRNSGSQGKQATPADIRYCYELLIQGLPGFFQFFPGDELLEETEEAGKPEEPETSEGPEAAEGPEKEPPSKHGYSILEDRSGEATEDVFADMMKELLRKMK